MHPYIPVRIRYLKALGDRHFCRWRLVVLTWECSCFLRHCQFLAALGVRISLKCTKYGQSVSKKNNCFVLTLVSESEIHWRQAQPIDSRRCDYHTRQNRRHCTLSIIAESTRTWNAPWENPKISLSMEPIFLEYTVATHRTERYNRLAHNCSITNGMHPKLFDQNPWTTKRW